MDLSVLGVNWSRISAARCSCLGRRPQTAVSHICGTRGANLKDAFAFAFDSSLGQEVGLLQYYDGEPVASNRIDASFESDSEDYG